MEIYELNGKQQDNLLETLLKKYNLEENSIIFRIFETKTNGLFKSTNYTIKAVKITEVADYIKDYLNELLQKMGLSVNFEIEINNNQICIKMFSDNNAILIGKRGQTLEALQNICRQVIASKTQLLPYLILDVEDYKQNQNKNIEKIALKVAQEVKDTGIPAVLDNMNSYERRIVHNVLLNFDGVATESEGIEPNRHVVIKKMNI